MHANTMECLNKPSSSEGSSILKEISTIKKVNGCLERNEVLPMLVIQPKSVPKDVAFGTILR